MHQATHAEDCQELKRVDTKLQQLGCTGTQNSHRYIGFIGLHNAQQSAHQHDHGSSHQYRRLRPGLDEGVDELPQATISVEQTHMLSSVSSAGCLSGEAALSRLPLLLAVMSAAGGGLRATRLPALRACFLEGCPFLFLCPVGLIHCLCSAFTTF